MGASWRGDDTGGGRGWGVKFYSLGTVIVYYPNEKLRGYLLEFTPAKADAGMTEVEGTW